VANPTGSASDHRRSRAGRCCWRPESAVDPLTILRNVLAEAAESKISIARACQKLGTRRERISRIHYVIDMPESFQKLVSSRALTEEQVFLLGKLPTEKRQSTAEKLIKGELDTAALKKELAAKTAKSDDTVTIDLGGGKKLRVPKDKVADVLRQLRDLKGE
jgi:hypothetical protein